MVWMQRLLSLPGVLQLNVRYTSIFVFVLLVYSFAFDLLFSGLNSSYVTGVESRPLQVENVNNLIH